MNTSTPIKDKSFFIVTWKIDNDIPGDDDESEDDDDHVVPKTYQVKSKSGVHRLLARLLNERRKPHDITVSYYPSEADDASWFKNAGQWLVDNPFQDIIPVSAVPNISEPMNKLVITPSALAFTATLTKHLSTNYFEPGAGVSIEATSGEVDITGRIISKNPFDFLLPTTIDAIAKALNLKNQARWDGRSFYETNFKDFCAVLPLTENVHKAIKEELEGNTVWYQQST